MAGKSESAGGMYEGVHFSKQDKQRQNDNFLVGETWKTVPNTDFGYYSNKGRGFQVSEALMGTNIC